MMKTDRFLRLRALALFPRTPVLAAGLAFGAALMSQSTARAVGLTIPNFSFENPVLTDGNSATSVPGWTVSGDAGVYNPPSTEFTGAAGQNTPSGANGAQIGYAQAGGSLQSAASLTNILSGNTYTLTLALGENLFGDPGTVRVGFLLNDAFVTGRDIIFDASNYATRGTFKDYTFSFTATAADAGKTLKIYLGQTTGQEYVSFDNVRLDGPASPAPEPSTYAIMALGVVALGLTLRQRRASSIG